MADLNDQIAEQAEKNAATEDPTSKETPEKVAVNLGGRTFEFDNPALAREVQSQFDSLHGSYGAELDNLRRQALQTIGTPPQQVAQQIQRTGLKLELPPSDLLFVDNGKAWAQQLAQNLTGILDAREEATNARIEAGVQVALEQTDQKLSVRDAMQLQKELEWGVFYVHPELQKSFQAADGTTVSGRSVFNAVKEELAPALRHLPANVAYERIGEAAARQWAAIAPQSNGNGTRQTQTSPAPRLLSSAQRGASTQTSTPTTTRTLSDMIAERQEENMKRSKGRAA